MARDESKQADFYVATDGNDDWSGELEAPNADRSDGPFATLTRARDAVRELKKRDTGKDIVVLIRGGAYYLRDTVVFGLQDSAEDGHTITYAAYPGEEPVISSGVKIEGWKELELRPEGLPELARAKVWVADVPTGLGRFRTLYDGDRRLPRARSHVFAVEEPEEPLDDPHSTFRFSPGTIKNWTNIEDVDIIFRRFGFTITILSLESVDEDKCIASTSIPGYGRLRSITSDRLWGVQEGQPAAWVENVIEALDSPGEWVLNTEEGKLYLWPMGDEPGDNILAPCLRELIRVEGDIDFDGPTDTPVRGIAFRGLTLTHGDRGVVVKGDMSIQHDWEMIDKADSLIRLRGAEECAVEECKFSNSGASAVRLDLHCQRNKVLNNEINHLGGAGILLIGYGPGTKDVNRQNEIVNNHIHRNGEIYWHSHGIVMWQSGENHVANNCIHHMPRKAICLAGVRPQFFSPDRFLESAHPAFRENTPSIRWHEMDNAEAVKECAKSTPWARLDVIDWPEIVPYLHTRDNVVEYNEIYRVGEILSDGAALNITGVGDGNIIRRNYIHHLFGRIFGAIRTDDFQRCTTIEENVIYKVSINGLCTRHENYWINNVLVDIKPDGYIWVGSRAYDGARIVGNILFHPGGEQAFYSFPRKNASRIQFRISIYEHFGNMSSGEIDRNIYYNLDAPESSKPLIEKLREVGHGKNDASIDPLFVDWENGDFRLKPDSPALKMGIKSIDVREAGLTEDFPKRFLE